MPNKATGTIKIVYKIRPARPGQLDGSDKKENCRGSFLMATLATTALTLVLYDSTVYYAYNHPE